MIYKDDWEEARQRMMAWWSGEVADRAVVQVTAPQKDAKVASAWNGWHLVHNLAHPERTFEEFEKHCQGTYFGGEALPNLFINLGPGIPAAYLGCTPRKVR